MAKRYDKNIVCYVPEKVNEQMDIICIVGLLEMEKDIV